MTKLEDLIERKGSIALGGGQARIEKQHEQGKMTARERLETLFDPNTFVEIDAFVVHRCYYFGQEKQHFPGDAAAFHQVVHAVQGFEQRGFSAAGRANESGDLVCTDVQIHIFKRMKIAVIQIEVVDRKFIHKFVTFALLKLFWRARRRAR